MILIIAAMHSEVRALIENLKLKTTHPYMTYEGVYQTKEVVLVVSGVGKSNASSALSHMLTLYPQIRQVVNIGIAGGHKVDLYEAFVVSEATYHDVDLTMFNYEFGQIPRFPTIYYTEMRLINKLTRFKTIKLYSGDVFSTKPISSESYVVDMEGASIYQIAHTYKYQVLSIKVVSDVIGNKNQLDIYKKSESELSDQLLEVLDQVLEVL